VLPGSVLEVRNQ